LVLLVTATEPEPEDDSLPDGLMLTPGLEMYDIRSRVRSILKPASLAGCAAKWRTAPSEGAGAFYLPA
jgi:hypothetical protein